MQESGEFANREFPGTEQIVISSLIATQCSDSTGWLETSGPVLDRVIVDSFDFRCASVESMNSSGYLIWKIAQYSEHKTASTVSPPFYSVSVATRCACVSTLWGVALGRALTSHFSLS